MKGMGAIVLCFQLSANLPRSKSRVRIPCPALFNQQITAPHYYINIHQLACNPLQVIGLCHPEKSRKVKAGLEGNRNPVPHSVTWPRILATDLDRASAVRCESEAHPRADCPTDGANRVPRFL